MGIAGPCWRILFVRLYELAQEGYDAAQAGTPVPLASYDAEVARWLPFEPKELPGHSQSDSQRMCSRGRAVLKEDERKKRGKVRREVGPLIGYLVLLHAGGPLLAYLSPGPRYRILS